MSYELSPISPKAPSIIISSSGNVEYSRKRDNTRFLTVSYDHSVDKFAVCEIGTDNEASTLGVLVLPIAGKEEINNANAEEVKIFFFITMFLCK